MHYENSIVIRVDLGDLALHGKWRLGRCQMKGRNTGHTGVGPSLLNFEGSLGMAKTVFRYPTRICKWLWTSGLSTYAVLVTEWSQTIHQWHPAYPASPTGESEALSVDGVMIVCTRYRHHFCLSPHRHTYPVHGVQHHLCAHLIADGEMLRLSIGDGGSDVDVSMHVCEDGVREAGSNQSD